MITVAKDIKQHSKSISDLKELKTIAAAYAIVKDYVFSRYSGINSLNILNTYKKDIRDEWVSSDIEEMIRK